jgi:2-(1,2-epoxy-1,2-dihydrophenyl)acetyl-CoA isomerase
VSRFGTIEVRIEEGVARITLDRPGRSNAFDAVMVREMEEAFASVLESPEARALVITGRGSAFCAGGDVRYMQSCVSEGRIDDAMTLVYGGCRIVRSIHRSSKPVIAAVNGAAVGGGASLALACDLRIVSRRARFHLTYTRLGLAPAWGGSYFLPRLAGPARAMELLWRGAVVTAAEAAAIGLASAVVEGDELEGRALETARELAAQPPEALAYVKRMAWSSPHRDLDSMLTWEEEAQRSLFGSEEVRRILDDRVRRMDGAPGGADGGGAAP